MGPPSRVVVGCPRCGCGSLRRHAGRRAACGRAGRVPQSPHHCVAGGEWGGRGAGRPAPPPRRHKAAAVPPPTFSLGAPRTESDVSLTQRFTPPAHTQFLPVPLFVRFVPPFLPHCVPVCWMHACLWVVGCGLWVVLMTLTNVVCACVYVRLPPSSASSCWCRTRTR